MTTALEGGGGQRHASAALYPHPVPIVQEVGWDPGPVWTGAENLAASGIRSPDCQPLASHDTDWATLPAFCLLGIDKFDILWTVRRDIVA